MTAKQQLLERVQAFSEAEAVETLRLLDMRGKRLVDEWGDVSKLHEVKFGETMCGLAEQERAAGHEPW